MKLRLIKDYAIQSLVYFVLFFVSFAFLGMIIYPFGYCLTIENIECPELGPIEDAFFLAIGLILLTLGHLIFNHLKQTVVKLKNIYFPIGSHQLNVTKKIIKFLLVTLIVAGIFAYGLAIYRIINDV